ncbi:MAG TPA: DUF1269 domain-containing protein [Patescibacteria group bacterium]
MAHLVAGLFHDSESAGRAVAELKQQGFTQDMSVISRDYDDPEGKIHNVKHDVSQGAKGGAVFGAAAAGITALIAGLSSITIPGLGLIVAGPLASVLTAAAGGAAAGGVVGALADYGIPDTQAKEFQQGILAGDVVVAVSTDHDKEQQVEEILDQYGVDEVAIGHK